MAYNTNQNFLAETSKSEVKLSITPSDELQKSKKGFTYLSSSIFSKFKEFIYFLEFLILATFHQLFKHRNIRVRILHSTFSNLCIHH